MHIVQLTPGTRFGRLTVVGLSSRRNQGQACWECRCDCGNLTTVISGNLRRGITKSCGCLYREFHKSGSQLVHGGSRKKHRTPEYRAWINMRQRCYDPKHISYKYYGALGVTVAPEWHRDFPAFLTHVGPRPTPKHSIDRINPWGNYEPGNIRWATKREQVLNQRKYQAPPTNS